MNATITPKFAGLTMPPAHTPPLYAQDGLGLEGIVYAHYFIGGCDWFVTEYDPETRLAFGWVCLGDRQMAEQGTFSMEEVAQTRIGRLGFRIDHEDDWEPRMLRQAIAELDARTGYNTEGK